MADAAGVPPKKTVAPNTKSTPVIVTDVPPAIGPEPGETVAMNGKVPYVNAPAFVPVWPSGLVTTTSTDTGEWAGATACSKVALLTVIDVAGIPPKLTSVVDELPRRPGVPLAG
jgi:hypothetical protein